MGTSVLLGRAPEMRPSADCICFARGTSSSARRAGAWRGRWSRPRSPPRRTPTATTCWAGPAAAAHGVWDASDDGVGAATTRDGFAILHAGTTGRRRGGRSTPTAGCTPATSRHGRRRNLSIVGRIKDIIIRGGENVYPREIEDFLDDLPAVCDARVIGIPSERYGEEVMAWIKLRDGGRVADEDLAAACRGRTATYKIPPHWKIVDAFPVTVTGKVQKFRMRELAIEELGLRSAGERAAR